VWVTVIGESGFIGLRSSSSLQESYSCPAAASAAAAVFILSHWCLVVMAVPSWRLKTRQAEFCCSGSMIATCRRLIVWVF